MVLVCFAVANEAGPFRALRLPGTEVLVTGMGPRPAERATLDRLALTSPTSPRPTAVITAGFAGALDPTLATGAVLFDADPQTGFADRLRNAGARAATFHQADRVAVTASDKTALRQTTGADAVEMESAIIRRLCRDHGIPSATVRAISDTASEDLPLDFNRLLRADGRLDALGLALQIAGSPGRIPALLRLGRHSSRAARALARVLAACLNPESLHRTPAAAPSPTRG